MAAATDAEMLVKVNEAIQAVLLGKSYAINGRTMTREDLSALLKAEQFYTDRIARAGANPYDHGFGLASLSGP